MTELIATAVLKDPQLQKAKEDILATVERQKKRITTIRPPQNDLIINYELHVKQLSELRGQELFYPYLGSGFGNGTLVELADGSVKYDLINGIGTHWGHCHPKLIEASLEGSFQDLFMQGNLQQNRDSLELQRLLTQQSGFKHCILSTSGAMANENALKLIFQKKTPAHRLLSFERCFMGRTLALSQITDRAPFREGLPLNLFVDYIPFYDHLDPKGSTERALACLQAHLKRYPEAYACMCIELVQGEAGSYPGTRDFFLSLFKVLREHGILIFVDEIQTFGRTDRLFAYQHFALEEYVDIVTCGKLLHACATLFHSQLRPKPGLISQTFTAATSSIRIALTLLKSLIEEDFLGPNGKNREIHNQLVNHLQKLADRHPERMEGPFGYGLMIACTPFKGEREKVIDFAKALFQAGVIAFTAGSHPTRLRFLPAAGSITADEIRHVFQIIETTLMGFSA